MSYALVVTMIVVLAGGPILFLAMALGAARHAKSEESEETAPDKQS